MMRRDDVICSNCGNKVDVNHKFCTRCGYITIYNVDIKNCGSSVGGESIDNDIDDGKKMQLYLL